MTTSNDPDVIRAQIEATRAGLSNDVNELGDKVSPGQIAKRQKDKVTGAVMGVKDHIMGSANDAKSSTTEALSSVGDAVSGAPGKVAQQTKGSPLAAGLIAFGAGLLLSGLIPASRPEAQAAAAIKAQAQPLVDQLTEAGKDAAGNLQEPAQQALESVKATATDAVGTVKDEGASAAGDVKNQAQDAKDTVQQHASSS
jgi:gas vesicle protein